MLQGITKPTLLLDKQKCIKNIEHMINKAKIHNLIFRPHFKTHQSIEIGKWFSDYGVKKITVSSIEMAQYFFNAGWRDICIAIPVNINEIDQINKLAKDASIIITVCSTDSVEFLNKNLKHECGISVKIDAGYNRTGILWNSFDETDKILEMIGRCKKLYFRGFLIHDGHTYGAKSPSEVEVIHNQSNQRIGVLKTRYSSVYESITISSGDTPSCAISNDFTGIDEIRPGNFVFFDLTQMNIGSCTVDQIAVALAAPVIAKHAERNEVVIYGGSVHLSKDSLKESSGTTYFGQIVEIDDTGHWGTPLTNTFVSKLSQEHGTVKFPPELFNSIKIGTFIGVLPVHSCLTADLCKGYIQTGSGKPADHLSGKLSITS